MQRSIFITETINKDTASEIIRLMKQMEQEGNYPIKVYINCYGGDVGALFSILDAIKTCKCEVITVNIGEADSAASLILAAGVKGKRFVTENSRVMLHEVHISTIIDGEPFSAVDSRLQEWSILNERYLTELSGLTGKTLDQIKADISGKDVFLTAEEAISYGVADKIVTLEDKERFNLMRVGGKTADEGGKPAPNKQESQMNKDEMIAALKTQHGVDVAAITAENSQLKEQLEAAKAETETLTASKKELEEKIAADKAALEASKKEAAFEAVVKAGKEFANMKEQVLATFDSAEKIEAFYKDRPTVLHTKPAGQDDGAIAEDEVTAKLIKEGKITKEDADKYLK